MNTHAATGFQQNRITPRQFWRMFRTGVMFCAAVCFSSTLFAQDTAPPEPPAVVSPSFLESVYCAVCHANSSRATAMRDRHQRGIAPFDMWRGSAMANASRDPYWRAVLSAEVAATPSRKALIEEKCTRCHAPMVAPAPESPPGQVLAHLTRDDQRAWLGMDGVSCTVCHQIRDEGLGTEATFTGHFVIGEKGPIFGPHQNPFAMPMQHLTGYTPTYGPHILKAGLCATCHTLDTDAVDADGSATGHRLHEQSPYLEWRNSIYNDELPEAGEAARSCQACHMPTTDQDGQVIETRIAHNPGGRDFPPLRPRSPFGRHVFFGGNVLLTRLLMDNPDQLDIRTTRKSLKKRLKAARAFLEHQTAELAIGSAERAGERLRFPVTVTNLAGHKLPTAYPSRRVWLRVEVRDAAGQLVFASGQFDGQGHLIDQQGQPLPSEAAGGPIVPHYQRIRAGGEVQVYQSVMADAAGQPTFTLLRGATYMKDNRLLPRGWQREHADAKATAPAGVDGDEDFSAGQDVVFFDIPVAGNGPISIRAWLHYQVVSPRHASELFKHETPEVETFRKLYAKTELRPETLATAKRRVAE